MLENVRTMVTGFIASNSMWSLLFSTLVLIIIVLILRALASRFIIRHVESVELRRRWLVQSRNGLVLLLLLGLVLVWGEELRTVALSIVAIAVAFVVATKELILCMTGSILKTASGSFKVGDRIQVRDFRGDVIDQNLLATTILEVGPGRITHQRTGRMTVIPNALFMSEPVINESFTHDYVLHVFTIPFNREDDWQAAQQALLESANRHCQPYLQEVRIYMSQVSIERGLDVPSVDPRVTIQVPVAGEIHLIVRVPAKLGQRGYIEQAILNDVFIDRDYSKKKDTERSDKPDS
ncbi:MAG: mechanosensitive ion channel domain-containing protein [Pseudohongiellaceae bacterium]